MIECPNCGEHVQIPNPHAFLVAETHVNWTCKAIDWYKKYLGVKVVLQEINDEATKSLNWHTGRGQKVARTPRLLPSDANWLKKLTDPVVK
jgi:hypothetical protein